MSFDDAERLDKAMRKDPRRATRIIIIMLCIIVIGSIAAPFGGEIIKNFFGSSANQGTAINQTIKGAQNKAINSTGNNSSNTVVGDSTENTVVGDNNTVVNTTAPVYVTYETVENVIDFFNEILSERDSKVLENQELKSRLAEIHKKEFKSVDLEADAWADQFIAAMPILKDKIQVKIDKQRRSSDKLLNETPALFEYTLDFAESRVTKLSEKIPGLRINRSIIGDLFRAASSKGEKTIPSIISFPNGHQVEIRITQGHINNGFAVWGPQLKFTIIPTIGEYESLNIIITQPVMTAGGRGECRIQYTVAHDKPMINQEYKKHLSDCFDRLLAGLLSSK